MWFCKVLYDKRFISKYLDSLEKEVNTLYKGEELETLYIGGGTPSSLSVEELEKLFIILQKFKKKKIFEFSIECNFDSINFEKLLLFKKYGVNRLSFGLESTNQEILKFLNRDFDRKHAINIVNEARKLGFNNINIDLMYAFPKESMEMLNKDLDFILDLDVEHISTYSLIIEPHTKLFWIKLKIYLQILILICIKIFLINWKNLDIYIMKLVILLKKVTIRIIIWHIGKWRVLWIWGF